MKLIQGIEIKTSKIVRDEYKFVHFCENQIEIRSKFDKYYVLENDVLDKKMPGNLGSYIYPYDAIMCFNNNYKINKNVFKEIMKNATTKIENYYEKDLIFDVPSNCIEEAEEEYIDIEEESDSENNEGESEEEEVWEDDEEEEISDENDENTEF